MSAHQYVRNSFAVLFGLTIAGAAFARRPPALVQEQAKSDAIIAATCSSIPAIPGNGYRDALVRFEAARSVDAGAETVASCAGTQVQTGSGYRDMVDRVRDDPSEILIARR